MNRLFVFNFFCCIILIITFPKFIFSQEKVLIKGITLDTENNPLPYVNIFTPSSFDGTSSDENGNFSFKTDRKDTIILNATMVGYKKYEKIILSNNQNEIELKIKLKPLVIELKDVIITASSYSSIEEKGLQMTGMDILTTPGGAADVFQAIKTLPGITQVQESAEIYVRGGDPNETITLIDQASLYHPYTLESNFGGLFSNINVSLINDMYFSSGAFSAKYGNALSGVLELQSKNEPENRSIMLGVSMAASELNISYPIKNNLGIIFSARGSYTYPIFLINGGTDQFSVSPVSRDFNNILSYKYSKTGRLKLNVLYANDEEEVHIDLPGYKDIFKGNSENKFINLYHTNVLFDNIVMKNSISFSQYNSYWDLGILDLDRIDKNYKIRNDFDYIISSELKINAGFEIEKRNSTYKGIIPTEDYDVREEALGENLDAVFNVTRIGSYFELEKIDFINIPNLFFTAGIRNDVINKLNLHWFDPRINLGYKINKKNILSFGYGIFHQYPDPRLYSQIDGNPNLKSMSAEHYIISYNHELNKHNNLRLEFYYKDYKNLPLEDTLINYSNDGYGYAKGIDFIWKGNYKKFSGWISYGFLNSKRLWMDYEKFSSSDFDITHNFTAVIKYNFNFKYEIGINYKYATGKPMTPVIGSIYHTEMNVYEPVYGIDNSSRQKDYQRLDIRFTYFTNLFNKYFTVLYMEGLNILNTKNIFGYSYNFDYTEKKEIESYFGRRLLVFGMQINL